MITTKRRLLFALAAPIVILVGLGLSRQYLRTFGSEVTLPIVGYDPRDLISGHYIVFSVDYGTTALCTNTNLPSSEGFVCLDNREFSYEVPTSCKQFIRGLCEQGRFNTGLEKYFIPEDKAQSLDQIVRQKRASIVVSVSSTGRAQTKKLLIDGVEWDK